MPVGQLLVEGLAIGACYGLFATAVVIIYKTSEVVDQSRLLHNLERVGKLLAEGEVFLTNRKYGEAIKTYEQVLRVDPHHVELQGRLLGLLAFGNFLFQFFRGSFHAFGE